MQASRTNLIVAALVVLLAIVGWVMYASVRSNFDDQATRFAAERTDFTGRIEGLTGEREQLSGRVAELEQTLTQERAAAGDLASLQERIASTGATLNQRMEALGARERDLADANAALDQTKHELAALDDREGTSRQQLNARLTTLGERERQLADTQRALSTAQTRQQQLQAAIEKLGSTETEKRAVLGALNLEIGTLDRERAQRATELASVRAELQAATTLLAETQDQLDKALLAKSVTELRTREADLQGRLDELDAEIAHKGPLFDRSVDVSEQIATVDEQLRSLTEQRQGLADQLADLVSQIGQSGAGEGAAVAPDTAAGQAKN